MLDILPGKILRPSEDTNSDSWPARDKSQMLDHWNWSQSSIEAPQYSEQSQILWSRAFVRHAHTHKLLPSHKEEEKRQGLRAGWGGYGWWKLRGAQASSEVTREMCRSLWVRGRGPQIFIQTGAAFPASIPPTFQAQAAQLLFTSLPRTTDPALPTSHCIRQSPILRNWRFSCASGAAGGKGQAGEDRAGPTHSCCWDKVWHKAILPHWQSSAVEKEQG